ncbi:hypothetical protein ABTF44_22480 [Acinetobacter baumannii]
MPPASSAGSTNGPAGPDAAMPGHGCADEDRVNGGEGGNARANGP